MNVAEYLVNELIKNQVTDVFGIPGGVIIDFLYALNKNPNIEPHLSYHEQCSAFEACGYSQVNHSLACAYATRGPGFTNLITGIADAYADSLPVLFITAHEGKVVNHNQRFEKEQEMDTIDMVKNITKYADVVDNIDELEQKVSKAINSALTSRKGPVLLDFSSSLWKQKVKLLDKSIKYIDNKYNKGINCNINYFFRNAKKPVILIGDGIRQAGVEKKLSDIINNTNIPVLSSRGSQDCGRLFYNYYGYIGSHGIRYSNYIFEKADLVICLGNRLAFPLESESYIKSLRNKKIIRIECDDKEIDREIPNTISICLDLKEFLDKESLNQFCDIKWLEFCKIIKNKLFLYDSNSVIEFLSCLYKEYSDSSYVIDVGNNEFWASRAYEISESKTRIFYSKSFGTLGCALAKAIGVYYKSRKHVICIVGDQGIQLNIQELQLIAQERLPILIVIINNHSSGMIKDRERKEGEFVHTTYESGFGSPNFKLIAQSYGIKFREINGINEILNISLVEPFIIDYHTEDELTLEPSLPKGNVIWDMIPKINENIEEIFIRENNNE